MRLLKTAFLILRWITFLPLSILGAAYLSVIAGGIFDFFGGRLIYSLILPSFVKMLIIGSITGLTVVILGILICPRKTEGVKKGLIIIASLVGILSALGAMISDDEELLVISNTTMAIIPWLLWRVEVKNLPLVKQKEKPIFGAPKRD